MPNNPSNTLIDSAITRAARTPSPNSAPNKLGGRLTLGLIALCFAAPVFLAILFQSPLLNYHPAPTKNLGELINPVVAVPEPNAGVNSGNGNRDGATFGLVTTQSAPIINAEGQWTILYLAPAACGTCVEQTSLLAHVRLAMGRELGRVKLELISPNNFALPPEANFTVRRSESSAHTALLQSLGLTDGGVVLLDPLRNAMMRYPANFDGSKIRKDLARLLKASQLGKTQSSGVTS